MELVYIVLAFVVGGGFGYGYRARIAAQAAAAQADLRKAVESIASKV